MKRRASRTAIKRLKAEDNPKKAFKLEEDQGYVSVLLTARVKKQLQKLKDVLKKLKAKTVLKGKKAAIKDVLQGH